MNPEEYIEFCVSGCRQAHRRLAETIKHLDDEVARRPSLLPDWTVGHVLTHIARNADSHVRMLRGALAGEHLEQYAGGYEQRAADIEAGSGRPASALVEDVLASAAELDNTFTEMTPEGWASHGMGGGRPWPCTEMPPQRWREVEVHHLDLGMGYGIEDWPFDWVSLEFRHMRDDQPSRRLLAWIMGRSELPNAIEVRPWTSSP
jgi:maleylpyruvate isomerase